METSGLGRPTKFTPETTQKVISYFEEVKNHPDRVPYIEELELELDIDDDTLNEWSKDKTKPDFSAAMKKIKILQRLRLLKATMEKGSCRGAIFQLQQNHKMNEKSFVVVNKEQKESEGLLLLRQIISQGTQFYRNARNTETNSSQI